MCVPEAYAGVASSLDGYIFIGAAAHGTLVPAIMLQQLLQHTVHYLSQHVTFVKIYSIQPCSMLTVQYTLNSDSFGGHGQHNTRKV